MPRGAVTSGASQKPTGSQGPAVIDLTTDSDDEQEGTVPVRRYTAAGEHGAKREIKQEGSGRMAAAPVAQRMQGATEVHPAVIQQGNAATAARHKDQQAPVEHRGKSGPRVMALFREIVRCVLLLNHIWASLYQQERQRRTQQLSAERTPFSHMWRPTWALTPLLP